MLASKTWMRKPPAITTGLIVFLTIIHSLEKFESLDLTPGALFSLDLNKLSFYPMAHPTLESYLVNLVVFIPIVAHYELHNGTVRTGVVLNVLAMFPGIAFCIVATLSQYIYAEAWGLGLWTQALIAFFAYQQRKHQVWPQVPIPMWTVPLISLLISCLVALPIERWLSFAIETVFGYALGAGLLDKLVEPTSKPAAWIEAKLAPGINVLRTIVHFVDEVEARDLRTSSSGGSYDELPVSGLTTTPGNLTSA